MVEKYLPFSKPLYILENREVFTIEVYHFEAILQALVNFVGNFYQENYDAHKYSFT
jgi:hypothetical protein